MKGSRLGSVSYETDRNHNLAPRQIARYRTENGGEFEVPFAADAEMDQPVHLERPLQARHPLFEATDPPHREQELASRTGSEGARAGQGGCSRSDGRSAYAVTGADPRTWCTAPAILASSGST